MASNKNDEKTLMEMAESALSKRYEFMYNVVTGVILWREKGGSNGKILDDYDLNSFLVYLNHRKIVIPLGTLSNLLKSSFVPKFDPFQQYFGNLPAWDQKTDFIHQLADTVKTTNDDLWNFYFKKWIVAMVACLLDEKILNHTMLVFSGEQGIGKTTWAENLMPDALKSYMYSGTIDPNNKDTLIFLYEKWLINVDELEILGRAQLGSLKQLITRDSVKIRRPYGRISENLPRRASFISSVNNSEFLHDLTGNRRFLGVEVLKIEYDHQVSLEGVYSQALYLWKNGFRFYFDKEEIQIVNKNNEGYRIKSLVEELLFNHFSLCEETEATDYLTTSEVLGILFANNKNAQHNGNLQQLGRILNAQKFLKRKRAGKQEYLLKRQPQETNAYQP